jgi:hypothetical protein
MGKGNSGFRVQSKSLVIPNDAFFFAAEEPVLSEAEGISVFSAAARQPFPVHGKLHFSST